MNREEFKKFLTSARARCPRLPAGKAAQESEYAERARKQISRARASLRNAKEDAGVRFEEGGSALNCEGDEAIYNQMAAGISRALALAGL